jgi:hypothetical protein
MFKRQTQYAELEKAIRIKKSTFKFENNAYCAATVLDYLETMQKS